VSAAERIPIAEGLFAETAEGPRLLGSRCAGCGVPCFPRSEVCHNPACADGRMEDTAFGPRGRLWSRAIQNYPPPAPARHEEPYVPYAIGVVDLDEGLRVVGRMSGAAPESVPLGCEVELALEPIARDEAGREQVTWTFRPLGATGGKAVIPARRGGRSP